MATSCTFDGANDDLKDATYTLGNELQRAMVVGWTRRLTTPLVSFPDPRMTPFVRVCITAMLRKLLDEPEGVDGITLMQSLPAHICGRLVAQSEKLTAMQVTASLLADTAKTAQRIRKDLVRM